MNLVINAADYLIMLKYFQGMLDSCRGKSKVWFAGYGVVIVLLTNYVNSLNQPYFNLVYMWTSVAVTSLWYKEGIRIKLLSVLLFTGISILADIISMWGLMQFVDLETDKQVQMYALLFSVAIRYFCVEILCVFKKEKNMQFPRGTTALLAVVLILSIAGSIGLNIGNGNKGKSLNLAGTLLTVGLLVILDFCVFFLIELMNKIVRDNHEKEMLLQEARFNVLYYDELEKSNRELAKIRHDLKNRLSPLYNLEACDVENARKSIRSLYKELDESRPHVLTRNRALNSILQVKLSQAEKEGIQTEYRINVSEELNMEYGDMGILFGNIMDNAIEACEKSEKKEIRLFVEQKSNSLAIVLENTKSREQEGTIGKTSKKYADGHGIGLKSVQKIVAKYDGMMDIQDYGTRHEIQMILYGVEGEKDGKG